MCGRYELHTHPTALALAMGLPFPPEVSARYNIAPTQQVPVAVASARTTDRGDTTDAHQWLVAITLVEE